MVAGARVPRSGVRARLEAELFTEPASGWADENQVSDYTAPDAAPDDLFGSSVGISADGSTTFASAPGGVSGSANEATYAGAAYSFTGATVTTTSLTAPDLTSLDGGGVQGTTGETTDLTAKVDPVPNSGSVAFTGPSGPISGCESVAVDPDTGEATCTVDLSETDTVTSGSNTPDEYSATYLGSGPFSSSTSANLDVTVVPLLTIDPTALPTIVAGSAQDFTVGLTPIGGIGPLTWSVVTGAGDTLPPTMSLTSSGEFDGTIDTPGSYSFTAQVTDASPASQTADEDLTWVVVASGQPTLSITPVTLPVGVVGSTYPVTTIKVTEGVVGTRSRHPDCPRTSPSPPADSWRRHWEPPPRPAATPSRSPTPRPPDGHVLDQPRRGHGGGGRARPAHRGHRLTLASRPGGGHAVVVAARGHRRRPDHQLLRDDEWGPGEPARRAERPTCRHGRADPVRRPRGEARCVRDLHGHCRQCLWQRTDVDSIESGRRTGDK